MGFIDTMFQLSDLKGSDSTWIRPPNRYASENSLPLSIRSTLPPPFP